MRICDYCHEFVGKTTPVYSSIELALLQGTKFNIDLCWECISSVQPGVATPTADQGKVAHRAAMVVERWVSGEDQ